MAITKHLKAYLQSLNNSIHRATRFYNPADRPYHCIVSATLYIFNKKNVLLTSIILLSNLIPSYAQEAFYIYRNDGNIDGFFCNEVDKFELSKLSLEDREEKDHIALELYTPDSLYRIPIAAIDSICFQQPETCFRNVEVCAHRYGKKMTYTDQSDQLKLAGSLNIEEQIAKGRSYNWIVALAKKYGIKIGFFVYYSEPNQEDFSIALNDLHNNYIWLDQYSYAPELRNKISSGDMISIDEFQNAYYNTLLPPFLKTVGYKPIALSYSYGNHTFEDAVCPLYLAARQSGDLNCSGTDYGIGNGKPDDIPYSFDNYKAKPSSYRWWDRSQQMIQRGSSPEVAYTTAINNVSNAIDATLQNGGWFRNFTHYHSMIVDEMSRYYAEEYYKMLAAKNENNEICFAGYGEAVAYLVYRQMIKHAIMFCPLFPHDNKLIIQLETVNSLNIDEDLLQIPISIRFSTKDTPLEGKQIASSCNIIKEGNDTFIVEIPYSQFPKTVITEMKE